MKKLYIAPELELLSLAPAERLANEVEIDFDTMLGSGGTGVVSQPDIDIDVELP